MFGTASFPCYLAHPHASDRPALFTTFANIAYSASESQPRGWPYNCMTHSHSAGRRGFAGGRPMIASITVLDALLVILLWTHGRRSSRQFLISNHRSSLHSPTVSPMIRLMSCSTGKDSTARVAPSEPREVDDTWGSVPGWLPGIGGSASAGFCGKRLRPGPRSTGGWHRTCVFSGVIW
jgi:hypothetical protein